MAGTAEILTRLVRRWWLLGLLVVLGALAGLGHALLSQPIYTTKAYVAVVARDPSESTSAVSYAQAYARIAVQGETLDAAAAAGNGRVSVSQLRRQVQASSSPDAPVIEITASADSASYATDLANLTATALVSTAGRHSGDTRMRLTVLSPATSPTEQASPRLKVDMTVGAALGLLLGGLAALAGIGHTGTDSRQSRPTSIGPIAPVSGAAAARAERPFEGRATVGVPKAASHPERDGWQGGPADT
jgi:capsular polysaccharide biosynthesis protein